LSLCGGLLSPLQGASAGFCLLAAGGGLSWERFDIQCVPPFCGHLYIVWRQVWRFSPAMSRVFAAVSGAPARFRRVSVCFCVPKTAAILGICVQNCVLSADAAAG